MENVEVAVSLQVLGCELPLKPRWNLRWGPQQTCKVWARPCLKRWEGFQYRAPEAKGRDGPKNKIIAFSTSSQLGMRTRAHPKQEPTM